MNILRAAKEHWEDGTLVKGAFGEGKDVCARGAIEAAGADLLGVGPSYRVLADVLVEMFPDRLDWHRPGHPADRTARQHHAAGAWHAVIPKVNDHPDTTHADMIAALDKAAVRLDEEME